MQLEMGIIKIEVSLPEATQAIEEFKNNRVKAFEKSQVKYERQYRVPSISCYMQK